jgi:hypothetical protein
MGHSRAKDVALAPTAGLAFLLSQVGAHAAARFDSRSGAGILRVIPSRTSQDRRSQRYAAAWMP